MFACLFHAALVRKNYQEDFVWTVAQVRGIANVEALVYTNTRTKERKSKKHRKWESHIKRHCLDYNVLSCEYCS